MTTLYLIFFCVYLFISGKRTQSFVYWYFHTVCCLKKVTTQKSPHCLWMNALYSSTLMSREWRFTDRNVAKISREVVCRNSAKCTILKMVLLICRILIYSYCVFWRLLNTGTSQASVWQTWYYILLIKNFAEIPKLVRFKDDQMT